MTKNGNVLSSDLMTVRYLAESMNGSGRNEKDVKGVQRRNDPWNLTNGKMRRI